MKSVLDGVRVLDFGRYIAGPYCAAMLAEHGAEVIRIEKRTASEDRVQAPITETGEGGLFLQMNRNKLGMTLDPMKPEGQEVVRKLVATADDGPLKVGAVLSWMYVMLVDEQADVLLAWSMILPQNVVDEFAATETDTAKVPPAVTVPVTRPVVHKLLV